MASKGSENAMFHVNNLLYKQPPPPQHPFRFKPDKALEALLYISKRVPNNKRTVYFLNKLFFYADLKHLEEYSRYIAGDFYVAMPEGPVPSNAYNMLKEIAGREDHGFGLNFADSFTVNKGTYLDFYDPRRDADEGSLSPSDIECLDFAIKKYGHMSKDEMEAIAHEEPAYKVVVEEQGLNRPMEVTHFARFLDGGDDLIGLLTGEK